MHSELNVFKAVAYARQLVEQGRAVSGAAIDIAAREFNLSDRLVARYTLPALRGCDLARELLWFQRRQAQGETPEVSLMGDSSLSLFDYV